MSSSCREPPDFSKAGHWGDDPPWKQDGSVLRRGYHETLPPIPSVLACNERYRVHTMVMQPLAPAATCEGFDFSRLLAKARARFSQHLRGSICLDPCTQKTLVETGREWHCYDGNQAYLMLWGYAFCLPNEHPPDALGEVDPAQLRQDHPIEGDRGEGPLVNLTEGVVETDTVGCGKEEWVRTTIRTQIGSCAELKSRGYGDYVHYADRQAEAFYREIPCAEGCTKDPFKVLYRYWDCEALPLGGAMVWVEIDVKVKCR